jgi:hypothetical protein
MRHLQRVEGHIYGIFIITFINIYFKFMFVPNAAELQKHSEHEPRRTS